MSTARLINSDRPHAVVRDIQALLEPGKIQTVACLGLSFKPNIDDLRESPAVEVVKLLADIPNLRLLAAEPHTNALPHELEGLGIRFTDALTAIDKADIVVLLVDHRQFALIDSEALGDKKLVDTRGLWTWRKARRPDARIAGPRSRSAASAAPRHGPRSMNIVAQGWTYHALLAKRRVEFLGTPMHLITMDETLDLATEAMERHRPLHHTVVNVAKLVTMRKNAELREDVTSADVINIDGAGVVWGARLFGIKVPERVAGVDIMEQLFALCAERGFKPYLLGAEQHVLNAVVARLHRGSPEPHYRRHPRWLFQPRTGSCSRRRDQRLGRRLPVRCHADAAQGAVPQALSPDPDPQLRHGCGRQLRRLWRQGGTRPAPDAEARA